VDRAGPTAGFALAGAAGALAVLTTMLRSRTLAPRQAPVIDITDTDTAADEQPVHQEASPTSTTPSIQPSRTYFNGARRSWQPANALVASRSRSQGGTRKTGASRKLGEGHGNLRRTSTPADHQRGVRDEGC
jgi:hypothetical protein